MILNELKRASSRLYFKVAILLGVMLCIMDVYPIFLHKSNILYNYIKISQVSTSFNRFMLFNDNNITTMFYIMLPILSCLGYSDSYLEDEKSKFIVNIFSREKKYKYLLSKYISNFIVGGIALAVPLVLNYLIIILMQPSIKPDYVLGSQFLELTNNFSKLFYEKPHLYIYIWIIIYFLYGGILASISVCFSLIIKNKYLIIFIPFVIIVLFEVIAENTNQTKFSPFFFMSRVGSANLEIVVLEFFIIILITISIFMIGGLKSDHY